jgi:hypothetical protein
MPVMVAVLQSDGDDWLERERGFVVPDPWPHRASERLRRQSPAS